MVAHGQDGWELVDYSWNEKTGVGTYTYERVNTGCFATGPVATAEGHIAQKAQPYHPSHTGWHMRRD